MTRANDLWQHEQKSGSMNPNMLPPELIDAIARIPRTPDTARKVGIILKARYGEKYGYPAWLEWAKPEDEGVAKAEWQRLPVRSDAEVDMLYNLGRSNGWKGTVPVQSISAEGAQNIALEQAQATQAALTRQAIETPHRNGHSRHTDELIGRLDGFVGFDREGDGTVGTLWHSPIALADVLPPVEAFTDALLPLALQPWVIDAAERSNAPVEYVAVSAMVSLGAALGRKIALRPKRLDDWCEFGNLWGAVVGPPSWMKSPALEEGKRPLAAIEAHLLDGFESLHREWEAEAEYAKAKRDGARDQARAAAKKNETFEKSKLVADPVPDEPQPSRLIVNDATVPALCEVLRANQNGVLVYRDELAGFIAELDQEGMEGSRGFYLTAWSGKDGHTQDRITRGTNLRVPFVCLSMLGGIQPSRVAPLLRESIATGGGDGFLARFSLIVWPDSPGEYKAIDREPNERAREDAYAVYKRLYELDPSNVGAELVDGSAPFLRLDPTAAEMFTVWDVEFRNRLRFGTDDGALAAHLLKYPKTVCGLALLCHLADGGTGQVSEESVMRALAWSQWLESHARRLYASLGQSHIDAARSLLNRIKRRELADGFKLRDVYRRGWAHLADIDSARAAIDVLEAKYYLRSRPLEKGEFGGRPTMAYDINPALLSGQP